MNDPILLFLIADAVALLLLGALAPAMASSAGGFLTAALCGLGALLCLPPLLMRLPASNLSLPIGPPGLSLHFVLDPLSAVFLVMAFLAGTAIAAFGASAVGGSIRTTALCAAGTAVALLGADGVALAIGVAIISAAMGKSRSVSVPVLTLIAICLLTPAGYAPRFDAIRAAPADSDHAIATLALTVAVVAALAWPRTGARCWTRDALTTGLLIPFGSYLLLRVAADLSGPAVQSWWGSCLLLAGGGAAVIEGWRSAMQPDIDFAIAALVRRQAALATASIGLALVARAADLPAACSFALDATLLSAIGASLAGTLISLSAHAIGTSAGTYRLSRLGGLIHTMPGTSAAMAAGLLALSALPPGLGFATLWLSFQFILSAPRTGGLLSQLPLALVAAAIALSASLATAASVRVGGIALLGRPRTPRGAGAAESRSPIRTILLTLAGASLAAGVLPRPILWLLADPAIHDLIGLPYGLSLGRSGGIALLSVTSSTGGYLPIPILALLALAIGGVILLLKRARKEVKPIGPWLDGMPPEVGLPFGEPAAQSAGTGFLPVLPVIPLPRLPSIPRLRPPSPAAGVWLVLALFGTLLLVLAVVR